MHLAKRFKDRVDTALSRYCELAAIVASVSVLYFQSLHDRAGGKGSSSTASKNNKSGETKDPEERERERIRISAANQEEER